GKRRPQHTLGIPGFGLGEVRLAQLFLAIPPRHRPFRRLQDALRLGPIPRPTDRKRAEIERRCIRLCVGAITVRQWLSQSCEPRSCLYFATQRVEDRGRQAHGVAHAACRTSGRLRPYLAATSVARLTKSARISSLVRCLIFHLRKISLFFDFEPPKNFGRYGQYSLTAACNL